MKNLRKHFLKLFTLILVISLLSACSSSKNDISPSSDGGNIGNEIAQEDMDSSGAKEEFGIIPEGEKVIKNYYISLETLDYEKMKVDLDSLIKKHNSFIENSNVGFRGYEYSKNYRYADFTIRIPKEKLEAFKIDLEKIGNLTNESTDSQDVTKFYRDTESRLTLVKSKEKRLLELLEKAVKIEDIIAIESELTDTIYEKEMLERDLKSIDEKIEYTTLSLSVSEVRNFSNVDKGNSSLMIRLKNAFKDSLFAFRLAIENFIIWFVYAIPYILLLGVLALLLVVFLRKRTNRKS